MSTIPECKKALKNIGVENKLRGRTTDNPFGGPSLIEITVLDYHPEEDVVVEDMQDALPDDAFLDIETVDGFYSITKGESGSATEWYFYRKDDDDDSR